MFRRGKQQVHDEVQACVKWWLLDMSYKAPEQLTVQYYEVMAEDIARIAVGKPSIRHKRFGERPLWTTTIHKK